MNGTITLVDGASLANVTDAGFYYKLTSAGDESYVKYSLASLPPASTSISRSISGLSQVSYTYYAYAVYSGKGEVTGSTQTFTPTTPPATKTYTLTIDHSTLDQLTSGSGYATYNGDHTITATASDASEFNVTINSNQVLSNASNNQWQKSKGVIYNKTDLVKIKSVTVNSTSGTFTTTYGTSESPSNASLGDNDGYFKVAVGSATGYTTSIVVTFEK